MSAQRQRALLTTLSKPSLPKHVRIRFDPVRQAHAVLSPERVFWPNEISLDILRRCDGATTVAGIVEDLAAQYAADAAEIADDVTSFLQEWSDRLLVRP